MSQMNIFDFLMQNMMISVEQNFRNILEEKKYDDAIQLINNEENQTLKDIYLNVFIDYINKLSEDKNYDDCLNILSKRSNINSISNDIEAEFINLEGVMYFRKKNFEKAFSLFENAINRINQINQVFQMNLYNSFFQMLKDLLDKKNYQQILCYTEKILNAKNNSYNTGEKAIIKFIQFRINCDLDNKNEYEALAKEMVSMVKNEIFDDKTLLLSVLAFLYYTKTQNVDKAYEIISYAEPKNIFIYLNHKIHLTYLKIQKLLRENKKNEAEKCLESIELLEINENQNEQGVQREDFLELKKIREYSKNLFIEKEIENNVEKNQFEEALNKCEKLIEKDKDYMKLRDSIIKKQKTYLFKQQKEGKIDIMNYIDKFGADSTDISSQKAISLMSNIINELSSEEIINGDLDKSKQLCDKGLEKNPDDINLINTKALINAKNGDLLQAKNDIDKALQKEPTNENLKKNKLQIINDELFKKKKLSEDDKVFIKEGISSKNEDIQIKSLDLALNSIKRGTQNLLDEDNLNKFLDDINGNDGEDEINENRIILNEEDNNNENNNNNNNNSNAFIDSQKMVISSKKAELIKETISPGSELKKEIKNKISKSLVSSQDKTTQNNLLDAYTKIKNIEEKDAVRPLDIINVNLNNEKNNDSIQTSLNVLEHFVEKNIEINEKTKSSLINYIKNNDFTEDTKEIIEEKSKLNPQNIINTIKERRNEEIKNFLEKNKNNAEITEMINTRLNKLGIDLNKKVLNKTQENLKQTSQKALNCMKSIASSKKGLSEEDLNNLNSLLENDNEGSKKEFGEFLKNETIDIIDKYLETHSDKKLPEKMINNISNNIQSEKQIKILENQILTKESSLNLLEKLNEENTNDNLRRQAFKVLDKNVDKLKNKEKKRFDLEKNNQNIMNKANDNEVVESLNNIGNLVKDGYMNNQTQNTLSNLLDSNNEEVFDQTLNVIDKMTNNDININKNISDNLVKTIKNKRNKKEDITKLLTTLVHIVNNNQIQNQSMQIFIESLNRYKNSKNEVNKNQSELDLAISGLLILSKNHCSPGDDEINICIDMIKEHSNELKKENIINLAKIISIIFDENNIKEEIFNKLFDIISNVKFNEDNKYEIVETLSKSLLNSIKFKDKAEINCLIKNNIINIKKIINEKEVYESIIILIQKVDDKNIFKEETDIYNFLEYTENCEKGEHFEKIKEYLVSNGIKNKKYFSILQNNLKGKDFIECMHIIINKNENYNFIDELNINKVISNFEKSPEISKNIIIKYLKEKTLSFNQITKITKKLSTDEANIYANILPILKQIFSITKNIEEINYLRTIIHLEDNYSINKDIYRYIKEYVKENSFLPKRYLKK